MDTETRKLLLQAGWSPDRRVDVRADLADYLSAGYEVWPGLQQFLAEFSGIRVRGVDAWRDIWIDSRRAVEEADPDWVEAYEDLIATTLAPIGGYQHMTILLGKDGRLYGGFDAAFGNLGNDLGEALHTIFNPPHPPALNMSAPTS